MRTHDKNQDALRAANLIAFGRRRHVPWGWIASAVAAAVWMVSR